MKVKFYIELSSKMWDYNLDCLQGRDAHQLFATSKPSGYKSCDMDLIEFEVDIPDMYFEPRKADVVLHKLIKSKVVEDD